MEPPRILTGAERRVEAIALLLITDPEGWVGVEEPNSDWHMRHAATRTYLKVGLDYCFVNGDRLTGDACERLQQAIAERRAVIIEDFLIKRTNEST